MPARQSTHTPRAVNATTFETSILDLNGAGLAVLPRVDLATVEIRICDAEQTTTLVLGQALAVAKLLIAAAVATCLRIGP